MRTQEPADPERSLLIRTRRLITVQVTGAFFLGVAAAGTVVYFVNVDRDRVLRVLIGAEAFGLPAGLLIGQMLARRAIAPVGDILAHRRRFAVDVSHELRAPLTRLHTQAQLLARRSRRGTPALRGDEVDLLVTGTRQLGEVVDDLLRSAQVRQPHRPYGRVDIGALAEELAAAEAGRAAAHGVTIVVRREGPGDHVVRGVETALRRVISALIDNALGHVSAGGHIWVTVSAGLARMVELTVQDDGVGLDPRQADRLFTGLAGGTQGFGLGLALASEVVAGHGGTITAAGRPGAGAVFTVRIPAAALAAEADMNSS